MQKNRSLDNIIEVVKHKNYNKVEINSKKKESNNYEKRID